jgi:hypothetical protein
MTTIASALFAAADLTAAERSACPRGVIGVYLRPSGEFDPTSLIVFKDRSQGSQPEPLVGNIMQLMASMCLRAVYGPSPCRRPAVYGGSGGKLIDSRKLHSWGFSLKTA